MVKSMFAAVAGLRTHQSKMDVIGNNIANVNTYGYKKARVVFKDQFYATLTKASEAGSSHGGGNPSQVGYGSLVGSIDVNFASGGVSATDVGMDALIDGNGFFLVGSKSDNGYRLTSRDNGSGRDSLTALNLTRVGSFNIDGQGNLVDSGMNYVYGFRNYGAPGEAADYTKNVEGQEEADGERVLEFLHVPQIVVDRNGQAVVRAYDQEGNEVDDPQDPSVTRIEYVYPNENGQLPDGFDGEDEGYTLAPMKLYNMGISSDGTVSGINDQKQIVVVGRIAIANVPNPNALEAIGNSLYQAGENTGIVTAEFAGEGSTGLLVSGSLEMSNVDLAQEFTDMITTQRGFQANTRIITVTDEMLQELVNIKR